MGLQDVPLWSKLVNMPISSLCLAAFIHFHPISLHDMLLVPQEAMQLTPAQKQAYIRVRKEHLERKAQIQEKREVIAKELVCTLS